jgi:DsbC/DsbD-like thiol-disulfide interchange protein
MLGGGLVLCASASAPAEATPIPHGTLELIAENQSIAAGHSFDVGLHFELEKGWHVYWVNPGDSGEPPRADWRLSAGLSAGAIEWPTPRRLQSAGIVDYGYEDAVLLIVPMRAESEIAGQQSARLDAEVKLLVCSHEMCIPGRAKLTLTLPVRAQAAAPEAPSSPTTEARTVAARTKGLFLATRKLLPRPAPLNWKFSVADANDSFVLTAKVGHSVTQAIFFPLTESQIENAAAQKLQPIATGFQLTLRKSEQLLQPIGRLKGVLVVLPDASGPHQAYSIDVPVGKPGQAKASSGIEIHPVQSLRGGPRI